MAPSLKTTGAWEIWSVGAGDTVRTNPGTPAAGDRYFVWAMWKPFNTVVTVAGFTEIEVYADGALGTGNGTGSISTGCWYRDWVSGDPTTTTITATGGGALGGTLIQLWQKDAAETWDTPTFATANWPATATNQTINASSTATVPSGSVVMCGMGFRNDIAAITRTTTSISATSGVTWNGNYVESPATHLSHTTGNDAADDLGHRFVTTGGSGITLQAQATISTLETGSIVWVIQGVTASTPATSLSPPVKRPNYGGLLQL